ncbi:MAG: leucine--tRNA ligase [Bacteroidota bacterium]
MDYNHLEIERKWRKHWSENQSFKSEDNSEKPKYYVLDMFPYPSGAGLHVGHPLGYIASDIYARYKRLQGFNVLHPMGYDSFGLPAEQYAIQTGQHPEKTTRENIARYRDQLDKIGFSFDWSREVRTSDPSYYKWTQWIFIQLFDCWYNTKTQKAERIADLVSLFEAEGNAGVHACTDYDTHFSAADWKALPETEKEAVLQEYRLAYLADSWVNWCPALGTVLANDEVVNGVSERGGHPVEQKLMRQWSMRIKAYAERLLTGLDKLDWTDSIKDMQRNWIGKSQGCSVNFQTESGKQIEVFTTRPDTIYGVSFMVLAPEHPLAGELTTADRREAVEAYVKASSLKTERDRQANVKHISGEFLGSYAIHPFTGEKVQLWIGDYVLASYGTGAVMAVPCGDQRDWDFAKHFGLEIKNIFENIDISEGAYSEKSGKITNSGFLDGLEVKDAMKKAIGVIEEKGLGHGKTNYRLRDAVFSRQRYWGEPFPVYYKNGLPQMIATEHLPIVLPEVENYLPTPDGQPPLGNATQWAWDTKNQQVVANSQIDQESIFPLELNTMPGWAGSSWYFLRYMDPNNEAEFVSKKQVSYWKNVDLYIGGAEHATGHLLYARFWTKFLFDQGYIDFDEPFQKMINQGMILGRSSIVYRTHLDITVGSDESFDIHLLDFVKNHPVFVSAKQLDQFGGPGFKMLADKLKARFEKAYPEIEVLSCDIYKNTTPIHADISLVDNDRLDIEGFKQWRSEYKEAEFILEEDGSYICGSEVEKMSKSKFNVQTPDELVEKFGADVLRMYEMFLGPLEQSKPWDTKGINGVSNFLRKLWRLFNISENGTAQLTGEATKDNLKSLHKCIHKVSDDLNRFSFNTGVSNFMICVNELTEQKCSSREILSSLVILMSPYAPHVCEELWVKLGNEAGSVSYAQFPSFNPEYLVSDAFSYPISFNGKVRFNLEFPTAMSPKEIEELVLSNENTVKWLEGNNPKKVIVVPGRIVNVVV